MKVTWVPSPNCADARRKVGDIRAIVLHDTECDLATALTIFQRTGGVSAHYVVNPSGEVTQCVDEAAVAYHAAAFGSKPALNRHRPAWLPPYNGRYSSVNAATIGVELAGYAAAGFTPAQYAALGTLCHEICERWGLTPTCLPEAGADATIVTHGWLQTDRSDPGPHFDWAAFEAALQAAQATAEPRDERTRYNAARAGG